MMRRSCDKNQVSQGGFSLMEMMIAILLFIIVTGAIYGLLEVSRSDRLLANQRVELMQSMRVGINAIGRDALNAGFGFPNTGAVAPSGRITQGAPLWMPANNDRLTTVMGDNNVNGTTVNGVCTRGTDVTDPRLQCTDQVSFVYRDVKFSEAIAQNERVERAFPTFALISPFTKLVFSRGDDPVSYVRVQEQSPKYYLDGSLKAEEIAADGSYIQVNRYGRDNASGGGDDLDLGVDSIVNERDPVEEVTHTDDLMVVTGGSTSAVGLVTGFDDGTGPDRLKVFFAGGDGLNLNNPAAGNPLSLIGPEGAAALGSAAFKINWVAYRVIRDDISDLTATSGTLVRVTLGSNGPGEPVIKVTPIVYNVSDFQVRYVLANGQVVDGTAGIDAWTICQVFVTVTVTSPINERRSNSPVSATLSSTFNTRNVIYTVN